MVEPLGQNPNIFPEHHLTTTKYTQRPVKNQINCPALNPTRKSHPTDADTMRRHTVPFPKSSVCLTQCVRQTPLKFSLYFSSSLLAGVRADDEEKPHLNKKNRGSFRAYPAS